MAKKVTHTITRIIPDSKVVYVNAENQILFEVSSVDVSGITTYNYRYFNDRIVQIYIVDLNYIFLHLEDILLGKKDALIQVSQIFDKWYENP